MVKPPESKNKPIKHVHWYLIIPALLLLLSGLWPKSSQSSDDMTPQERRIAKTLSMIEGAGQTQVVIYTPENTAFGDAALPTGAVIVSQGAHDLTVQLRLTLAAQTLLSLNPECIRIFPMEAPP